MEDTVSLLKSESSADPRISLNNAKLWDCRHDVFDDDDEIIVIRKEKINEGGQLKYIRRVFVKQPQTKEYSNVGWVVDGDVDACMLCATYFSFFNGRHHCRICGDMACRDCSTGEIVMSEFQNYGPVRACDQCYYGQVGGCTRTRCSQLLHIHNILYIIML
jgi:hypothetical protein